MRRGRSPLWTPLPATKRWLAALLAVMASLFALDVAFPPPIARAADTSPVVEDREGRWLRGFTTAEGRWRLAADLDRVDPRFVKALIEVEDKRFWLHPGVDPIALVRASASFVRTGEVASGASTITMQLARLLEPRPRHLGSKLIEMIRALQIERRLSKREILEAYLTLAPYGGNLEGVRAASRAYFDKDPTWLDDAEIALLIALPQAPEARRPDRRPEAAAASRARILRRLGALGLLEESRVAEAQTLPVPQRRPFPVLAEHLAFRLVAARPGQSVIATPLDADLQNAVERLVAREAARLERDAGAAVLVVHAPSREVRASVGGAGRARPGGWIDMSQAVRSPGSALKPFIYALAFDSGLAAPETLARDGPIRFSGYMPENFDRRFHGDVRLYEALQHSLNVPAVATLERIGAASFAAALRRAYASPRLPPGPDSQAGLALALGGVGMTLEDLVTLYAALADGGEAQPLRRAEPLYGLPRRFVRRETAEAVLSILAGSPTPNGRAPAALSENAPIVAYKTGTSYGFRDAWAFGVSGDWVVGVWVGRPDGSPRPGATGRAAALPLLFEVFDAIGPAAGRPIAPILAPEPAPAALARLQREGLGGTPDQGPRILFPPDGAEVLVTEFGPESRGLSLSAAGGEGALSWFAEGRPASIEATSGRALWRPSGPGFHTLSVIDAMGRRETVRVRIRDR
jgi:penicillin-binding protein 1C